jgi:hypothetical protein
MLGERQRTLHVACVRRSHSEDSQYQGLISRLHKPLGCLLSLVAQRLSPLHISCVGRYLGDVGQR